MVVVIVTLAGMLTAQVQPQSTAVVVATEVDAEMQQRMLQVTDWNQALERTVLDQAEVQRRLTSLPAPRLPDLAAVRSMLEQANDREAAYDTAGAIAIRRDVLQVYDNALLPSLDLQTLAATALQDIASSELAEGHDKEALEAARTAQRRFPNVALDARRHPPSVAQLFKRAAIELKKAPTGELVVTTPSKVRVMADGVALGESNGRLSVKLPQGTWRVWLADNEGTSLVHAVTVASQTVSVDVDMQLERSLSWTTVPVLRCKDDCDALLRALANRTSTDEAVGLSLGENTRAPANGRFVRADGTTSSVPVVALADLKPNLALTAASPPPPDRFSAWSLVPFGVGQLAQKRYVAGSIYGGIQAGLLAWNIVNATRSDGRNAAEESDHRKMQNLSAGLLIGAMVANVAEALIVDAVSD